MKIAIDLSPLQNAHRMRGIGYTLINFINNLPEDSRRAHEFVFFALPKQEALFPDPLELLDTHGMRFNLAQLKPAKRLPFRLPGRLNLPIGAVNRILRFHSFYFGDSRVPRQIDIDIFLQADQSFSLPSGRGFTKALILYDLIPQVLEWDYWQTYSSARLNGSSRRKASLSHLKRLLLIRKIRRNTRRATKLIAISEHSKSDFVNLLGVSPEKITVVQLGVSIPKTSRTKPELWQYKKTGWGYVKRPLTIDSEIPFLLFIGGVDSRRKIEDLVAAFNNLRAQGRNLKLVLAGDIILGPSAITTPAVSRSLKQSSYLDDIIFMGFIDTEVRDWLYANALAFVFPSRYEGFGLPVLEALVHGCPVISYQNDAVTEVAGSAPLYADDLQGIMARVLELMKADNKELLALQKRGKKVANSYSWEQTSANIIDIITSNN